MVFEWCEKGVNFLKWLVFIGLQVLFSTEAGEDLVEAQKSSTTDRGRWPGDPSIRAKWKVFVGKTGVENQRV